MKTMKMDGKVVRVEEGQVTNYLKIGYVFCPRSEWKKLQGKKEVVAKTSTESPVNMPKHKEGKDNSRGKDKKSKYARKKQVAE